MWTMCRLVHKQDEYMIFKPEGLKEFHMLARLSAAAGGVWLKRTIQKRNLRTSSRLMALYSTSILLKSPLTCSDQTN